MMYPWYAFAARIVLALRTVYHLIIAGYAARDLSDINSVVSFDPTGILERILQDLIYTAYFYVALGVLLLILLIIYPMTHTNRNRVVSYVIVHTILIAVVIYFVYIRSGGITIPTIVSVTVSSIYDIPSQKFYFPVSLVLDALSIVSSVVPFGRTEPVGQVRFIYA